MKFYFALFFSAVFFVPTLSSEGTRFLHLIVNVPIQTPEGSEIFVTGNHKELGNWVPNLKKLKRIGPGVYQIDITFPESVTTVEYKFTRGSYATQESDALARIKGNLPLKMVEERTIVVRSIEHWADLPPSHARPDLKVVEDFFSPQLSNHRRLFIRTPPGYETSLETRYPVLYIHDGQGFFGAHPVNGSCGVGIDCASERLVEAGQILAPIIVGVESISDRVNEYEYEVLGKEYARFLIDTVKPYIDRHYRTLSDRDHTWTMGLSLGASIAVSLVWMHSDIFSAAAGLSLPVFNRHGALLRMLAGHSAPEKPVRLYFDHGDEGQDKAYQASAQSFYEALRASGIPKMDIEYHLVQYGDHIPADWARRVDLPLAFMAGTSHKCFRKFKKAWKKR